MIYEGEDALTSQHMTLIGCAHCIMKQLFSVHSAPPPPLQESPASLAVLEPHPAQGRGIIVGSSCVREYGGCSSGSRIAGIFWIPHSAFFWRNRFVSELAWPTGLGK